MTDREPLDVDRLRAALGDRWARVDVVDETPSTNLDLLARAATAADRTALAAELQTAGRGRLDRVWTSPPRAGITVSVLLRPAVPLVRWGWLPLLTGVALVETVREQTGIAAALKWPNDLLAPDGRKLAGILVQTAEDAVVVGQGLNVSTAADELPVATASSLALAGADDVDRTALLAALLTRLDARVAQWVDVGGDAEACGLASAYRAACATIGERVRVATGATDAVEGTAVEVDAAGRLVLDTEAGRTSISAGDVEQVRTT